MGAALVCVLAAAYLAQSRHDAALDRQANEQGAAGHYVRALQLARRVTRQPADADALLVQAYALQFMRRLPEASRAFGRAARRDPNNWAIHQDWAVVLAQLGRRRQASEEIARALALNPRTELPPGFTRRG